MKAFSHIKDSLAFVFRDIKLRNIAISSLVMECLAFGFGSYVVLYEIIPELTGGVTLLLLLIFALLCWTWAMLQQNGVAIDNNKTLSFLGKAFFHVSIIWGTSIFLLALYTWAPNPDAPKTVESDTLAIVTNLETSDKAQVKQINTIGENLAELVALMNKKNTIDETEFRVESSRIESRIEMKYAETLPLLEAKAAAERVIETVQDIADTPDIEDSLREKGGQAVVDALLLRKPANNDEAIDIQSKIVDLAYLTGNIEQAKTAALAILKIDENDMYAIGRLGRIYFLQGDMKKTEEYFAKLRNIAPENSEAQVSAYISQALLYTQRGDIDQALFMAQQGLKTSQALNYKIGIASSYNALSAIYIRMGNFKSALEAGEKSLEINTELDDKEQIAFNLNNIGEIQLTYGNPQAATEMFKKSLEINQQMENKEGMARSYSQLGTSDLVLGNINHALEMYQTSLRLNEEIGNKGGITDAYGNIGNVYMDLREPDKALEMFEKVLKLSDETDSKGTIATTYNSISIIYMDRGENDKALEAAKKGLRYAKELGAKEMIATAYSNMGLMYQNKKDYNNSIDMYQQALNLYQEMGSLPGVAVNYSNMGRLYVEMKKYDKALEVHNQSLKINEQTGNVRNIGYDYANIAQVYKAREDFVNMKAFYTKSLKIFKELEAALEISQIEEELDWIKDQTKPH